MTPECGAVPALTPKLGAEGRRMPIANFTRDQEKR
jgi:hypothetical protein